MYIFSNPQLSSFSEPVPTEASDSCSWLTAVKLNVVSVVLVNLLQDSLCILRNYSVHHGGKECLLELP